MAVIRRHRHSDYLITDVVGVAQTILAGGTGAVMAILFACYVVQEETGAGTSAAATSVVPGANANIYNDGVDVVQLQVAADGEITVQRTAGADTFNVRLVMVWI